MARTLVQHQANVNSVDNSDKSALIYAAEHGHLEIVELLVACDWITQPNELGLVEAAQQAAVMASSKGNIQVKLTLDTNDLNYQLSQIKCYYINQLNERRVVETAQQAAVMASSKGKS